MSVNQSVRSLLCNREYFVFTVRFLRVVNILNLVRFFISENNVLIIKNPFDDNLVIKKGDW